MKTLIINKSTLSQIVAFITNPFLCVLIALPALFKRSKLTPILPLSISIALIFSYQPLMYDTSSNFYQNLSASLLKYDYVDLRLYNSIPALLNNLLNIQFMTVIFIYTAFIIYAWLTIYRYYKANAYTNLALFYMAIFVITSLIYRDIMDLNRSYLSASIMLLLIHYLENNNGVSYRYEKIVFYSGTFIATLIHPHVLVIFVLYHLAKIKTNLTFYKVTPIICLLLGLYGEIFVNYLMQVATAVGMPGASDAISYFQIDNEWGLGRELYAYDIISRALTFSIIFILYWKSIYLLKNDKNDTTIKLSILLASFAFIVLPYFTLFERYSIAYMLFSSFVIYKLILKNKRQYFATTLLITLFSARFVFINFFHYGIIYTEDYNVVLLSQGNKVEMALKPFYQPTLILLNTENNGYSDSYINHESIRGEHYLNKLNEIPALR